jgi:hypothetical protein
VPGATGRFPRELNRGRASGVDYQTARYRMFQTPAYDIRTDEVRDRYRTFFDNPFMPTIRHQQMPGADERVAYAAEFAAHQLGRIDEKLGRLLGIMERNITQSS